MTEQLSEGLEGRVTALLTDEGIDAKEFWWTGSFLWFTELQTARKVLEILKDNKFNVELTDGLSPSEEHGATAKIKFGPIKSSAWGGVRENLERWLCLSEDAAGDSWWAGARQASKFWNQAGSHDNWKKTKNDMIRDLEDSIRKQEKEAGSDPEKRKKVAEAKKKLAELKSAKPTENIPD